MIRRLIILLLIVGCAPTTATFYIGMPIEEFVGNNPQRMAIIIDTEQSKFMDRAVGTGTTWYYSVAVVDINGNRKFSDFISGWSNP